MKQNPPENPVIQNPELKKSESLQKPGEAIVRQILKITRGNYDPNYITKQLTQGSPEDNDKDIFTKYAELYDEGFYFAFEGIPRNAQTPQENAILQNLKIVAEGINKTVWIKQEGDSVTDLYDNESGKIVNCALCIVAPEDLPGRKDLPLVAFEHDKRSMKQIFMVSVKPIPISKQWAGLALAGALAIVASYKLTDFTTSPDLQFQAIVQAHTLQTLIIECQTGYRYRRFIKQLVEAQAPKEGYLLHPATRRDAVKQMEKIANWSGEPPQSDEEALLRDDFHYFTLAREYAYYKAGKQFMTDGDELFLAIIQKETLGDHLYLSY
jgi:hypothetical protein